MIKDEYIQQIKKVVEQVLGKKKVKVFLFGSATRQERFHDCGLGLVGKVSKPDVRRLQSIFEESVLPYKVDVVDFNQVSAVFKQNVFKQPIIWIKR
ncbi:MAG: hypothetical protein UX17_C0029G0018 [Parcubacteria group bacterium GW2011_GWC2_45_7]|nr:MAG: hypothetical protein UX17_C0029G0018 [Parcubacteria group bacterium GW2011_GWC2_45_7]KKU73546.1 MAG: hypothetical protein UX98_C0006G0044 [Parcubacteria group bacterium GW2011_GWA2_47_26]